MNRMPSRILRFKHQLKLLSCSTLGSFLSFKMFGCICYVHVSKSNRSKLYPKAVKCIFLGYALNQKGYKCYHFSTRTLIVSMNVTFRDIVSFFSPSHPYFQGGKRGVCEDAAALVVPVTLYSFDVDGCHSKGEQEVTSKEIEPSQKKVWVNNFFYVFIRKRQKVAPSSHVPL